MFYVRIFGILALVLLIITIVLFVLSSVFVSNETSQNNETSVGSNETSQWNETGANNSATAVVKIRSGRRIEQGEIHGLFAAGIGCAVFTIFFTSLAFLRFWGGGDCSEDDSTDENPSVPSPESPSHERTDTLVRGAVVKLSALSNEDSGGMPNEPPEVSSSNETSDLFREMREMGQISNFLAGDLELEERKKSVHDLTENAPSSAELCASSLRSSSQHLQTLDVDDPISEKMCASSLKGSSPRQTSEANPMFEETGEASYSSIS